MRILVTGAAGFIGYQTARRLLAAGHTVAGLDNLNDYYSPAIKMARRDSLLEQSGFSFEAIDLCDRTALAAWVAEFAPEIIVHLAAQAGVQYSLVNPHAYATSNVVGFLNILECARTAPDLKHLIYASSSSVYGANKTFPFSASDNVDHPVSLYAATKKSNELMAHTYAHLYGVPTTGLRFFTVYGPWGRPDMAYWKFTKAILEGEPIKVFNHGKHGRDLTYIDDVVVAIERLLTHIPQPQTAGPETAQDPSTSDAPYRIFNIGNNEPVALMDLIALIERATGRTAEKQMLPMQPGDLENTFADIAPLQEAINFRPSTAIGDGIDAFVAWYRDVAEPRGW
ncbi:MAG: NAD-dependent epimerase [Pseudomonadota bacterium]